MSIVREIIVPYNQITASSSTALQDEQAVLRQQVTLKRKDPNILTLWRLAVEIIKVSAASRVSAVAGAIAGVIRDHQHAEVQAIGAGAVNQAIKALVLAKGYLQNDGIQVTCVPEFAEVSIDDRVKTAIKLVVDPL